MVWLILLCATLMAVIVVLSAKIVLMRRGANEIRVGFSDKLKSDTNTLISVTTGDRAMNRLAGDINEQLRELRRQRHRFVQGDMELKNAVAGISHDLRTPLTAIRAYLELLEKAEKSETVTRYIDVIKNRTELLEQLTEELFRYSVITSPEYDTATELLEINGVLEESALSFYAALKERNIEPVIHITEHRVMRKVNRAALSRIFSNLMNNAIKYSDGDLYIALAEQGDITFSNTASGLSEVQVERLFDRFFTVESARKSTGLGLSIARILTEQMGGTITAGYENGKLNIRISFPAPDAD